MSAACSTGYVNSPASAEMPFRDLVFVGYAPLQQSHRRASHQQPTELANFGHVGLHKQRRPRRIDPQCQQIERRIERVLPQHFRLAHCGQRVQIGNEVVRFIAVLQVDVLPDGAEVVAPVESASGLNAGEDCAWEERGFKVCNGLQVFKDCDGCRVRS